MIQGEGRACMVDRGLSWIGFSHEIHLKISNINLDKSMLSQSMCGVESENNPMSRNFVVAHSSSSYLQTLAKGEAIAFVASLQKVKSHLSSELQWMSEQVQQKTTQLQGIEAILSEAEVLGLVDSKAAPESTAPLTEAIASLTAIVAVPDTAVATPTENGRAVTDTPAAAATPKESKQKSKQANSNRNAKAPTSGKTTSPKAKKPAPATKSTGAGRKPSATGLQQFLQADFQAKSITDSVSEILASSKEPLSTDDIMTELYHGLSADDYQRAKSSLSNMLSLGKTKGKWRNTGRGMYAVNTAS